VEITELESVLTESTKLLSNLREDEILSSGGSGEGEVVYHLVFEVFLVIHNQGGV